MCVRRYEDNWRELKGKLMERDVLEVLSLSAFCTDEADLEEKLRYCGEKEIRIQVKDARISPDVYLDILYLMKREEAKKREELKKAQYKGIVKALEKKKEGAGVMEDREQSCRMILRNKWNTAGRTISRWKSIAEGPC